MTRSLPALLASTALACAPARHPEVPARISSAASCTAPASVISPSPTQWLPKPAESAGSPIRLTTPEVAALLQGTYRLLIVNTEGYPDKAVAEWRLALRPPDAASMPLPFVGDAPGVTYPLTGAMTLVRAYALPGSRRRSDDITNVIQGLAYDSSRGVLWLRGTPFDQAADSGSFSRIYTIDPGVGFDGRWAWHTTPAKYINTPAGLLQEQTAGYFCGYRIR